MRLSHTADDLAKGQGHPLLCGPDLTKVANVLCTTPVFGPNTSATVWWRCEAGEGEGTIVVAFKARVNDAARGFLVINSFINVILVYRARTFATTF